MMTTNQKTIIALLRLHKNKGMLPSQITEQTGLSNAGVGRTLSNLKKLGLVWDWVYFKPKRYVYTLSEQGLKTPIFELT